MSAIGIILNQISWKSVHSTKVITHNPSADLIETNKFWTTIFYKYFQPFVFVSEPDRGKKYDKSLIVPLAGLSCINRPVFINRSAVRTRSIWTGLCDDFFRVSLFSYGTSNTNALPVLYQVTDRGK